MKRPGRPNLPAPPQKGERISVIVHRAVVRARVRKVSGGRDFYWNATYQSVIGPQSLSGRARRRDAGKLWVRGWDSDDAKALEVEVALR